MLLPYRSFFSAGSFYHVSSGCSTTTAHQWSATRHAYLAWTRLRLRRITCSPVYQLGVWLRSASRDCLRMWVCESCLYSCVCSLADSCSQPTPGRRALPAYLRGATHLHHAWRLRECRPVVLVASAVWLRTHGPVNGCHAIQLSATGGLHATAFVIIAGLTATPKRMPTARGHSSYGLTGGVNFVDIRRSLGCISTAQLHSPTIHIHESDCMPF